ncbi:hypothetical protein QBC38DRAFT_468685 [Podospora fimiseda]|uniref:SPT2 chromatin protein n=1 Tax=Podospora fimiseda TaxID=252190 RepID=A0AAN7H736_9PEZI|nr:hypothetical protein QBC38DRAFT_468685 [Podospora fimiseda]
MPISDLLASITGEKAGPSSTPAPRPIATGPKRKADNELRSAPLLKTPRIESSSADRNSRPNSNSPKPADKPVGSSVDKPAFTSKPSSNTVSAGRASTSTSTSNNASSNGVKTVSNGSKPLPARPALSRPAPPPSSSGPPKARSFAEIMARAKANAEVRNSLGKINHKPLERNLTMKERKELKAEEARQAKVGARKPAVGRSASAAGPSAASSRGTPVGGAKRNGVSPGVSNGKKGAPAEEEKKVKKAALATTGYTGTARPRPGATNTSKSGSAARSEESERSRGDSRYGYGAARRGYDRRGGYDRGEDLDDFIDYDEDEDEVGYGNRGGYSEDESDMEAGLSDIEDEETAAERRAREEDKREEALEKRLKREKEERKKRLLEQARSRAGNR